jgi:hypothetical protein
MKASIYMYLQSTSLIVYNKLQLIWDCNEYEHESLQICESLLLEVFHQIGTRQSCESFSCSEVPSRLNRISVSQLCFICLPLYMSHTVFPHWKNMFIWLYLHSTEILQKNHHQKINIQTFSVISPPFSQILLQIHFYQCKQWIISKTLCLMLFNEFIHF